MKLLSFKNEVFSEENEWRLIKGMRETTKPELLKFTKINQNLIPYLETYIADEIDGKFMFPLHSIKFGPMLDGERTKLAINLLAIKESIAENKIKIDASKLKVTGAGYELRRSG